jgi:hypothetical protein
MSEVSTHSSPFVPSPTESDYLAKDEHLLKFGKEQPSATPRLLGAIGDDVNRIDFGPNNFKYFEAELFSTKKIEFINSDLPMTDENFIESIKDNPNLIHNVITFNRKHNIRSFDFVLTYKQLNLWSSEVYKPVPITKQFKGSLIFSGCSTIFNVSTAEKRPLKLAARYELIGDSMGEDDSLDGFGNTKGGPKIILACTYDENNVYVYINSLFPFRINPIGAGKFQDISIGENTGYLTYEEKPKKLVETDHLTGMKEEYRYERNGVTYCDVYLSLRDTTISSTEGISVIPFNSLNITALKKNEETLAISPTRNEAIKAIGFSLASDTNTEVASDIHPIRFGNRALDIDKEKIEDIGLKIEERIKDAAMSVNQVPFIINESIRFHGKYSVIDEYFIDSNADSFGRLYIKEIGYYDAIKDSFNITSYFFDFDNGKSLNKALELKEYIDNASPEYAAFSSLEKTKAAIKTNKPLFVMKSFEFIDSADYQKYQDITYIQSHTGLVQNVFIELAKPNVQDDFDKLIYFSYNDKENNENNIYKDIKVPQIIVCNFKDYNMDYIIKRNVFNNNESDYLRITSIASYSDENTPYSNKYLIGTNLGVFYEMSLSDEYVPEIKPGYHNPFIHNDNILSSDDVFDSEAIVKIITDNDHIYFIGETKFALYDLVHNAYIQIDPEKYSIALGGKTISLVKKTNDNTIVFVSDGSVVIYDIQSEVFSSKDNNFKYHIDFRDNYASDFDNINYNFKADDIINAASIQLGQFVYLIGARNITKQGNICQKLNILTGDIENIDGGIDHFIKPGLCTDGKAIYNIGGKTDTELTSTRYISDITPFTKYDTVKNTWSIPENIIFTITDKTANGEDGRLGNSIPIMAQNDDTIYIFHPELVKITDINTSYFNNGLLKIKIIGDSLQMTQHEITGNDDDKALVCPLAITWIPIKWNASSAEFVCLYRVEESTTYYKYIRFKIDYTNNFALEIIENLNLTNAAFASYAEDYIILDALYNAKYYTQNNETIIFCRDKFILVIGSSGLPEVYALWNNEEIYADCKSLLSEAEFNYYWRKTGGNKTHLSTHFIRHGEYLVFAGGEGYRASDYFDLNTLSFLRTPRYDVFPDIDISGSILEATSELVQIPSSSLTVGAMSSCIVEGDIYIVTSIVTDSIATGNYENIDENTPLPLLLLFKIDTLGKDLDITLIKDLTPAFHKKGFIDTYKFINIYQVGKFIFISGGRHSYYKKDENRFIHDNLKTWNTIVYNTLTGDIIDFTSQADNIKDIGLFPLIFKYGKSSTVICSDQSTIDTYPVMNTARGNYTVGLSIDNGEAATHWTPNLNQFRLASENELTFKYASGVSYGKYGFIITCNTLEIVDIDELLKTNVSHIVISTILYKLSEKDKALFKDIFVEGNYLYIIGGLQTATTQNDSINGINNRMLKFYIPKLLKAYTDGEAIDTPEAIQLISPMIKYFTAYGMTKKQELISVGEIHFINENTEIANERDPFDALIATKGYIYRNVDKSFVKRNRLISIEDLPYNSPNAFNYHYHVFTINKREFILVYSGIQTQTSTITENVELYDVELHTWLTIPVLPKVLHNASFINNTIIGATEQREDLRQVAYINRLTLTPDAHFSQWTWEEEEFSFEDSSGFTIILEPYNSFAQKIYPDNSVKTLVVAKTINNLLLFNDAMVKVNIKSMINNTWISLPQIPASQTHSYKVIGTHIYHKANYEHLLVLLYQQSNNSFHLWDYFNSTWNTLFTNVTFGEFSGSPDENSFIFDNTDDSIIQIYGKWIDPRFNKIRIGRIKFKINDISPLRTALSIETCGLLDQFNNLDLDENTSMAYSIASGNLYFKDKNEKLHYTRNDDISFNIYNPALDNSADSDIVCTTFSNKINKTFVKHLKDALDIKQITYKNETENGIYSVFTKMYEADSRYKELYLSYYDIQHDTKSDSIPLTIESSNFTIPIDSNYEIISLTKHIPETENICFLLICHYDNNLTVFAVTKTSYEVNKLFNVVIADIDNQNTHHVADSIYRHCLSRDGDTIFQLASYNGGLHQLYKAGIDWEYIFDDSTSTKEIVLNPTHNEFANINNAINLDMCITANDYLVILTDKYMGGIEGEFQKRINYLYTTQVSDINIVPECFEQFEVPLAVGHISLVKSDDKSDALYIVPRKIANKQPIIKLSINNKRDIFKYHEVEYLEMDTSISNEVFYDEKDFEVNWVYNDNYLYNPVYGIKLSLFKIVEERISYSYKVNNATRDLVTFTTYGKYIYAINSKTEYGETVYYLDVIDTATFKRITHVRITKGSTITTQTLSIPIKGSIISISIDGKNIILAGGKLPSGQTNTKVYSISTETAVAEILFSSVSVGLDAVIYESANINAVYVFPKTNPQAIIIPYNKADSNPITINYTSSIQITHILLQSDDNVLKVIGKDSENNYLIADFDLLSGEISNLVNTHIHSEIKAVINNRNHAFIYVEKDTTHVDIYEYDIKSHSVSLVNNDVMSAVLDGPFKLDGYYSRNDFVGLKIKNETEYLASFYIFKMINPYYESLVPSGFPIALGSQIKNNNCYNDNAPLILTGLYEYIKIGTYNLKFDKAQERLIILTSPTIFIDCEELLWASPFYDNTVLIATLFREETIIYYINLETGKIIATANVTSSESLNGRKTTETAYVPIVKSVNGNLTTLGNVYLVGGESEFDIYQDIVEIEIVLNEVSSGVFSLNVYTGSIIPNSSIGSYKAKVVQLTSRQFMVLGGITYQHQSPDNIFAKIDKDLINFIDKIESNKVHYIIPTESSSNRSIVTRSLILIDNASDIYQPKGELKEVFVLSNHLYFVHNKYRYVAEINENRQLSNIILFREIQEGIYVPQELNFIGSANKYHNELNKDTNMLMWYNNKSYISNQFNYVLNTIRRQSKYDDFRKYIFSQIDDGVNTTHIIEPDNFKVIAIRYPSINTEYEFDLIFEKFYKNVKQKIYYDYPDYTVKIIDKLTILSRVPCTAYRLAIDKKSDYISEERMNQDLNMAFGFAQGSQELVRDDYGFIDNSWQVILSNGNSEERKISIVLDRADTENPIFTIYGDDPAFPFKHNLLPIVLSYGELEGQFGYRYYLFIDIEGNVVTFDKRTKNFITIDGLEDVHVPYFSGELILFPSKVKENGSIGKRVWGYSENNPYATVADADGISVPDEKLLKD